jgi:hypothetical protein
LLLPACFALTGGREPYLAVIERRAGQPAFVRSQTGEKPFELTQRSERRSYLRTEDVRLLPGREVPSPGSFMEVIQ